MNPEKLVDSNKRKDTKGLGDLICRIIRESPDQPNNRVLQQKTIFISAIGKRIEVKFEPSPELMDFLELCYLVDGGMERVLKVRALPAVTAVS